MTIPIIPTVLVSFLAAVGGTVNTLRADSGLSFLGHFIIATVLATCVIGATAGIFTLTGHLKGIPGWLALTLIGVGALIFISLAGLMGRGPYG